MDHWEAVVVGGGLAGLTAALELGRNGVRVLLIEKETFPRHKVCGEYISYEVVPYLKSLGINLQDAVRINTLELSSENGRSLTADLPLGGIGISRYALDYRLFLAARDNGADVIHDAATFLDFNGDQFEISTGQSGTISAETVIGAFGKRSALDKRLGRTFIDSKSPWLGVKGHFHYEPHPDHLVGLHAFRGGYGGLSKTETGLTNFCYLAHYDSFKSFGDINSFNDAIVSKNPVLGRFLQDAIPVFDKPLSIAQISFDKKGTVENHMLMCGDAAGLIHPLCGNGMAMAIQSGQMASKIIIKYLKHAKYTRKEMESEYSQMWNSHFGKRLWWGRSLQNAVLNPALSNMILIGLGHFKFLTRTIIRQTHGKPLPLS